jgi:NADH-quinone oxidoreductase subunit G
VIAEADLRERADPETVDRLRVAAETVILLDGTATRSAMQADIVLPVADWSEAAGTFVNHEGRAQRFFAVVPHGRRAGWRVLGDLFETPPGWTTLEDITSAILHDLPRLAPLSGVAPEIALRTPLGRIARAPWRMSGRTARDLAGRVVEGMPATDPDSALAFGMEGLPGSEAPAALRTTIGGQGLHSASATPMFTDGPRGPLAGGDPGVSLLPAAPRVKPVEDPAMTGEGLLPLWLHEPFAGDELGRGAARLAARCPSPVVILHPADAEALGLAEGQGVSIAGANAALTLSEQVPRGHVAASAARVLPRGLARRVRVEAVE